MKVLSYGLTASQGLPDSHDLFQQKEFPSKEDKLLLRTHWLLSGFTVPEITLFCVSSSRKSWNYKGEIKEVILSEVELDINVSTNASQQEYAIQRLNAYPFVK